MTQFALFKAYPQLETAISRETLGDWPTPLQPLENLSRHLGGKPVLLKRDDLSHPLYGGNKVRKLELLLAEARRRGCREIITAGGLGSHHVLATAALGSQAALRTVGLFFCQPVTERVRTNLLLEHHYGTEMHFVKDYYGLARKYLRFYLGRRLAAGPAPYMIMPGGSTPLSTIGYLNGALELCEQLQEAGYTQADAVFVAAGTGGTAAGLLAGLAFSGAAASLHAVRVVEPVVLGPSRILRLAASALRELQKRGVGGAAGLKEKLAGRLHLTGAYLGHSYGFCTPESREAARLFRELEGIELEECYTAKAAAALLDYCRGPGAVDTRPVVFVHTASTTHHSPDLLLPDPADLPEAFQWCFSAEARRCRCGLRKQNREFCETLRRAGWLWTG